MELTQENFKKDKSNEPPDHIQIDLEFIQKLSDAHDFTIAGIFYQFYGKKHRFVRDDGYWLYFLDGYWIPDARAQELYSSFRDLRERLIEIQKQFSNLLVEQIIRKLSNNKSLSHIIKTLCQLSEITITHNDLNKYEHLFACTNGVYNTETYSFIKSENTLRQLYLTLKAHVHYKPNAQCPKWISFLNKIFMNDSDLIRYVQKCVGLSLSGKIMEEKLFFAFGSGANGKTTFFEVLRYIFYNFHKEIDASILIKTRQSDQRLIMENLANLRGVRIATSNEIPERSTYNDSLVKQLCSRDEISAKQIFKSVTTFVPSHKLWIRSNHKPVFNIRDYGMLRRIILIPFQVEIPESDRIENYELELFPEAAGILNWIIEGWKLYRAEKLQYIPPAIRVYMDDYVNECDSISQFLSECTFTVEYQNIRLTDLCAAYNKWSKMNNFKLIDSRTLSNSLKKAGYIVFPGTGNIRYVKGLSVTTEDSYYS